MVLGSVGMWAIIDIIIKIMTKTESTLTQTLYLSGMMSLFSLPGAIYFWQTPVLDCLCNIRFDISYKYCGCF